MKKRKFTLTLVIVLLIISTLTTSVFADTRLEAETDLDTVETFDTTEAMLYALAPDHLYTFIYSGYAPYSWMNIDTTGCIIGRLYVYDENANTVTAISDSAVSTYATTQENIFYVTTDQIIIQSDFIGSTYEVLYTAGRGEITKLLTFGTYFSFVEGGQHIVVMDVPNRNAETVLTHNSILSAYMIDQDKLIYIDGNGEQFYLNSSSGEVASITDAYEENNLMSYECDIETEGLIGTYSTTSTTDDNYNDIIFPFEEYTAELKEDWDLSGISKYYTTTYANAGQCDGFAKYAHDRFWHLYAERTRPSWQTGSNTCTADYTGATPAQISNTSYNPNNNTTLTKFTDADSVKKFFSKLTKGSFVRYFSPADVDTLSVYDGRHSIVFDRIADDGSGVIVYESNQDGKCGVGYQLYKFCTLAGNYAGVLYDVTHALTTTPTFENVTYHTVECNNCDGYLRQTHTGTKSVACYSPSQHKTSFSCCTGSAVGAHTGTKSIAYYNTGYHKTSFGCCSGGVLSAHTSTTCTYSSRYYHTAQYTCCGSRTQTHTASAKYASYSVSKHKVTFACCDGYVLQAHTLSNGICTICGFGRTEAASTDNPVPFA